ncbi:unnamed protein product [Schistosoma margrebowiei]|uniref:Uncharacterized protein n=1 Tax=Schistosoma margrebowiei TaxID=48269 RepID=A0A3P8CLB9_9TREM|nr:unnamed protein product [Schistosoma margrebowiei]
MKYRLRSTEDSLFVELYPQFSSPSHRNDGEEEKIYLQLLCVTIISLVLVVFVVSIIFSCWWTKSYKIPIDLGITDAGKLSTYFGFSTNLIKMLMNLLIWKWQ